MHGGREDRKHTPWNKMEPKYPLLIQLIDLAMFPYQIQHDFPNTVLQLRPLWAPGEPCASSLWPQKGHETRWEEMPAKPPGSAEHCDTLSDTTGLLHCSYQQTQVQGQPRCTYWKLTLPVSCSQHDFKSRLHLLAVILFIITGPQDKPKRSSIVLSTVLKCLMSLFRGCSLELLSNKVFSGVNKFRFQKSAPWNLSP